MIQDRTRPWLLRAARRLCVALAALAFGAIVAGCPREPAAGAAAAAPDNWLAGAADGGPWNVLLITLDTTRADRLGCYGYEHPTTPNLDALAARGILFEQAITPAPITLPAHATILTGLDPQEHGVRHNSTFVLGDELDTAAEAAKRAGHATGAVLGAFPVDARFGLAQGFDAYDDDFGAGSGQPGWPERPAAEVTAQSLEWIEQHRGRPFFFWAHYYDPHHPYAPPPAFRAAFEDPYDGEIAVMDDAIGKLLAGLERGGPAARTWIIVAGDHGEALCDHGEATHSTLIYGATQCVPLLIAPPGDWKRLPPEAVRGRRINSLVRLRDLFPTMLNALGCAPESGAEPGGSLLALAAGTWQGPDHAYCETLAPALDLGWSELRGVRTARFSFIRAPEPELYDLEQDPGELDNIISERTGEAARLAALCDALCAKEHAVQRAAALDPDAAAKLRALGYAAAPARAGAGDSTKDPKDLVHLVSKINDAMAAQGAHDPGRARPLLEDVLAEDPANPLARRILIDVLLMSGAIEESLAMQEEYLAEHPGEREVLITRAQAHIALKDTEAACADLGELLQRDPEDAVAAALYVQALAAGGRPGEARERLRKEAAEAPESAAVRARLALFELLLQDMPAAEEHAAKALSLDADCAPALAVMGEVFFARGMRALQGGRAAETEAAFAGAREQCAKALSIDGSDGIASFRMGVLELMAGRLPAARGYLRTALAQRPAWADAHARMAEVCREMNDLPAALRHYAMAEDLGFGNAGFLLNFGIALARAGLPQEAAAAWERALEQNPPPPLADKLRSNLDKLREGR